MKKSKPDNRKDNVERIQKNISNTIQNIEAAGEMIAETTNEKMKRDLIEKNKRRKDALRSMRQEIKDEADARERGYR